MCDFAEYYHIYNLREFSCSYIATLANGLRAESRTVGKVSGQSVSLDHFLLAYMADRLAFLAWAKTKDAQSNRNHPESILQKLLNPEPAEQTQTFDTGEDFMKFRESMIGG